MASFKLFGIRMIQGNLPELNREVLIFCLDNLSRATIRAGLHLGVEFSIFLQFVFTIRAWLLFGGGVVL